MKRKIIVSKFGGTSMGDFEAMNRSAEISCEHNSNVVVVSATAGTTDKLLKIAKLSAEEKVDECNKVKLEIKTKHQNILSNLFENKKVESILKKYFDELDFLIHSISILKEITPKTHDQILSIGERISSTIFFEILKTKIKKRKIFLLDARKIIKTDSHFGKAMPNFVAIEKNCKKLKSNFIYVTQGFIGSDDFENTTVLGRGGSDYSAALFAMGLNANVLEIWTDVAGIATTDPRICKSTKIINEISYAEAGEMAQYGAKILHPSTIAPAIKKSIPIFVGSTFDKNSLGTWIKKSVRHKPEIRSIAKRNLQTLLTITNPDMLNAYGFMEKVFDIFRKFRISIDCVTTSEISIAITVDQNAHSNKKFMSEIKSAGELKVEDGYSLISLIGNNLFTHSSLAKKIFVAIENIPIRMVSFGASDYNFNFLIKENVADNCINKLHKILIERKN